MANPNLPINYQKNTYIGARYVPKFATPTEWDNTKTYEPLTIVTYQGNSYTSKTFVPVGVDILNDTYWAKTGNYNAQVEQYRQEVEQLETDVNNYYTQTNQNIQNYYNEMNTVVEGLQGQAGIFKEYKLVIVGDSYTDDNEAYPSYTTLLKQNWNVPIDLRHEGGSGFVHQGNQGHTYKDLVGMPGTIPNDEVTHVVFLGGYNDISQSGIQEAVAEAVKYAQSIYPNAKVMVGMIGNFMGDDPNRAYNLLFVHMGYQRGCSNAGGYYLDGLQYVLAWKDMFQGDGIHPNALGARTLCYNVEQAIMTGVCYPYRISIINLTNDSSIPYNGEIYMTQYGGYVKYSSVSGITGAYPTEKLPNNTYKILDLSTYCGIYNQVNVAPCVSSIYDNEAHIKEEIGNVSIYHGSVLAYSPSKINNTPSNWTGQVSNFKLGSFTLPLGLFQ